MQLRFVVAAFGMLAFAGIPTAANAHRHHGVHHHHRHAAQGSHVRHRATFRRRAVSHRAKLRSAPAHALAGVYCGPVGCPDSPAPGPAEAYTAFGGGDLLAEAKRHLGATAGQLGLPRSLWCADFLAYVLRQTGYHGTGSREARSYEHYGRRLPGPQVGAIAVLRRRGGGHVGVVAGVDRHGNPIIISGNHNHRVGEGVYPRSRVIAYVAPG